MLEELRIGRRGPFGGGGIFGGEGPFANLDFVSELLDWKSKLDAVGIDWAKIPAVLAAFHQISISETGEAKLAAVQQLVRAVTVVTAGTDLDDQFSAAFDAIVSHVAIRQWIVGLLDSNVPAGVLTQTDAPQPVMQELAVAGLDLNTVLGIISAVRSLIDLIRQARGK